MEQSQRLEVGHLLRNEDPCYAGAFAMRRLIHAVAEWNSGTVLALTMGSTRQARRFVVEVSGHAQPGWEGDVRWALSTVAHLRTSKRTPTFAAVDPSTVFEVLRERVPRERLAAPADWLSPVDEYEHSLRNVQAAMAWPKLIGDNLIDISEIMAGQPELMLKFLLSAATPMETAMLADELGATWSPFDTGMHDYLGRAVRARVLLGVTSGEVPARFIALVRRLGSGLVVKQLDRESVGAAWAGEPSTLVGHTVPEGQAMAMVRVPAASANGSYPGFSTQDRGLRGRPLDPVPAKPSTPIRLGSAVNSIGKKTDVLMDVEDLVRHVFVEGASGAGKSTFISTLVRALIEEGYGCTFLDPHGATVNQILGELPADSDNVRVVRYGDANSVTPLNIFGSGAGELAVERAIETFIELIQGMYDPGHEGIVGPRWRHWFGLIARATYAAMGDDTSIVAIAEAGRDVARVKRLAHVIQDEHPQLAKSLMDEIVNDRSNEAASLLAWCTSKLHPLVATGDARAVLSTGRNAVNATEYMDAGKVLLIDLASPVVGETTARFLGALELLKIRSAIGERTNDRPHVLIADESHLFEFGALPKLLAEGRKFGLGVVVATQFLGQLKGPLADALQSNAGTFISLRTGMPYAKASSVRLGGWPSSELVRLPNLVAAATLSRDGTMTEPFTLTLDHHQRMARLRARDQQAHERGQRVVETSRSELVAPFADATQFDAAELDVLLDEAVREVASSRQSRRRGDRRVETSFAVRLLGYDNSRVDQLLDEVRTYTRPRHPDVRELIENLPAVVLQGVPRNMAMSAIARLVDVGGHAELEEVPTTPSFLDEWLAQRQDRAASGSDDDQV